MNGRRGGFGAAAGAVGLVLWLSWARSTVAETPAVPIDVITVTGADGVFETGPAVAVSLQTEIATTDSHLTVQFAKGVRRLTVTPVPGTLQSLVEAVAAHISLDYSKATRQEVLGPLGATLSDLLSSTQPHVQWNGVKANHSLNLVYPAGLLTNTAPPQINNIVVNPTAFPGQMWLHWSTNDWATSEVDYGTNAGGPFPNTLTTTQLALNHDVQLNGLTEGGTYYYQVKSVNRDGFSATSSVGAFLAPIITRMYLPWIDR